MNRYCLYFLVMIFCFRFVNAAGQDSIAVSDNYSFEIMPVLNPWLTTSNPAGLDRNGLLLPGRMNAYVGLENGDYKRVQEGLSLQSYRLESQSFKRIEKVNLFGNFSYDKSFEKGLDYSNTNSPFRGTPYDMVDTIGEDNYNREFFYLNAALSMPLSRKLAFGIASDFGVGVSVQDHDPRPINKVLDIGLRSGILYSPGDLALGINLIYEHYNEEIDIDIIKQNTYMSIFRLLGPGVTYYHEAKSFNRLYIRNSGGIDVQLNLNRKNLNSLLGLKSTGFLENVQDGGKGGDASWNYMRDVSDLRGIEWEFYSTTRITTGSIHQVLSANVGFSSSVGIEKIEKLVQVGVLDMQDWVFFMDDPKYYSESGTAAISYTFLKMRDPYHLNYSVSLQGDYHSFMQKYFIPFQEETYQYASFSLDAKKIFLLKKGQVGTGAGIKFKQNIAGEQQFESMNFLYDKILLPDFLYITSNYFAPCFEISYERKLNKLFNTLFIDARVVSLSGNNNTSRLISSFRTGVIF